MKILRKSGLLVLMVFSLFASVSRAVSDVDKNYDKGVEYALKGKFIQAREEFKEALKIDPRHSLSKSSLKTIENAIDLTIDLKVKKEAAMHVFKGAAFCNKGVFEKGIVEFTKAIEINPKFAVAYNNRGNVYSVKGQNDLAISDYTNAIEINSKFAVAYNNRGLSYRHKGQNDLAISDYTNAIEINSKFAEAYVNRGFVYGNKGQHDHAISDFTKALEINPKNSRAYDNWGVTYFVELENKVKGCTDWKKACELGRCENHSLAKEKGYCP